MTPANKLVFRAILTGLMLLGLSCGNNPAIEARYTAEKLYFQADKLARDIQIKPQLTTDNSQAALFDAFDESLNYSLAALERIDSNLYAEEFSQVSSLAHRAATQLTKAYFAQKQFDTCVILMRTLLDKAQLDWEELIAVNINLAHSLQARGDFDQAIEIYNNTIASFQPPKARNGEPLLDLMNLPMFLVRFHAMVHDTLKAKEQFEIAEAYYQKLLADSSLTQAAHGNLARLYYDTRRWDEAIEHLSQMVDSTGKVSIAAQFRVADIRTTFQQKYDVGQALYDQMLTSLSGSDTIFIPVVLFSKSRLELEQGHYAQARRQLIDLQQNYPGYYHANPRAQYLKARTHDLEKNWPRAEVEYKLLISQYGNSRVALASYLYLAKELENRGRKTESEQWYQKAEAAYSLLAARGAGTLREAEALTYRADLYRQKKDWSLAVQSLTMVYEKFPNSRVGRESLLTAAAIYSQKLDMRHVADSLITEFKKNLSRAQNDWES